MPSKQAAILALSLLATPVLAQTCSITSFGAVGDGVTDNSVAIQNTFTQAASSNCVVLIPKGKFVYSRTLTATGIAIQGEGVSSVLLATNPSAEALILTGPGVSAANFSMISAATARLTTPQSAMILAQNASNYSVTNLLITNSASNGIMSFNSFHGLVSGNTVRSTFADAITQVVGTHDVIISENKILNAGDDGISNVSYTNAPIVYNVTVTGNNITGNRGGRGMSVVGGNNINFIGNYVDNLDRYCDLYIAAESEYSTFGVNGVTVNGNVFVHGGPNQGSLTVYNSQGSLYNIANVNVTNNQFSSPVWIPVQLVGDGAETGIAFGGNTSYTTGEFLADDNSLASVTQVNNQILPVTSYEGPRSGGCNFSAC